MAKKQKTKTLLFKEKIKELDNYQENPVWTIEDFKDARLASDVLPHIVVQIKKDS